MKWGRKKNLSSPSSSPSPSSSSIIARVLPVFWFSKFKQKSENSKTSSARNKHGIERLNFYPTPNSRAIFYSMDEDDPFWRLSFGAERVTPARRSTGGLIDPDWYDSDREFRFPVSVLERSYSRERKVQEMEAGCRNSTDMVSDIKKTKEREKNKERILKDIVHDRQGWRKSSRGSVRAKQSESEIDIFPVEDEFSNLAVSNSRKQHDHLEKTELNAIKLKKTKQRNKVRAYYSPRTECRIKALEEMKKAKIMKMKDKRMEEGGMVFSSFAVVKNSFDPQKDFRDSMVEMIREKRIRRSEDLEELLACYLALNSDEYHDVIIKAFQKVLFKLKGVVQYFDY